MDGLDPSIYANGVRNGCGLDGQEEPDEPGHDAFGIWRIKRRATRPLIHPSETAGSAACPA
jgi:hypothetical protein